MAKFRCPSCGAKNPVVGDETPGVASKKLRIPVADQCKKCGADLREPALESLDQEPLTAAKSAEEMLELKRQERYSRWQGLELRAQLHKRLGRSDEAEQDRHQAVEELTAEIERVMQASDAILIPTTIEWRALVHERAGDRTQGARDRLLAADVQAAGAGEAGAKAAVLAAPLTIGFGGAALGAEWAGAAKAGAEHSQLKIVRKSREALMAEGRAVGIGLCPKCGGVVDVSAEGRCAMGHKVEHRRYVVPEDAGAARAELESPAA